MHLELIGKISGDTSSLLSKISRSAVRNTRMHAQNCASSAGEKAFSQSPPSQLGAGRPPLGGHHKKSPQELRRSLRAEASELPGSIQPHTLHSWLQTRVESRSDAVNRLPKLLQPNTAALVHSIFAFRLGPVKRAFNRILTTEIDCTSSIGPQGRARMCCVGQPLRGASIYHEENAARKCSCLVHVKHADESAHEFSSRIKFQRRSYPTWPEAVRLDRRSKGATEGPSSSTSRTDVGRMARG